MALVGLQGAALPALFPNRSHKHSSIPAGPAAPSAWTAGVTSPAHWFPPAHFFQMPIQSKQHVRGC